MKPATAIFSRTLTLSLAWVLSLCTAQKVCAQSSMSEGEMQQMLNQMNSWQAPQQQPMQYGQQMQYGQPNQYMGMQQGGYVPAPRVQQMPPMGMQQMPYPQQMPQMQMQQMPNMGMQQMGMQQPMPQMQMNNMQFPPMSGVPAMPMQQMQQMPLNSGVQQMQQMPMNAGVGSKFNLSNLLNRKIGGAGGGGGMGAIFRQMAALNQGSSGSGSGSSSQSQSARDAIEYELSNARSMASQAVAYLNDARGTSDKSAKRSAASESRYYANEARRAAERAESRVSECPDAAGLASEARGEANRAESAAAYAADDASGW